MSISELITITFAGVAAISTAVTTFYSLRLWQTNRSSVELARLLAFVNLWTQLNRYCEVAREQNLPEAEFLIEFRRVLSEFLIGSLMRDLNRDKDEIVSDFYNRVEELINNSNINIENIGWLKHFLIKRQ